MLNQLYQSYMHFAWLLYTAFWVILTVYSFPLAWFIAFGKGTYRGLGSNGTKNQRKPYQRFSVSSSQAPISTKQLRMSASWLISVSRSCTLLSSSSSLRYGMVNS